MSFEWFISNRLILSQKRSFSRIIIRIASLAVALSLSVMIISTAVVNGFQNEIRTKVFSFWGHIHITKYDSNASLEPSPIDRDQDFLAIIRNNRNIRHVQAFITKAGIIKTEEDIEGVILKGVDGNFDWNFLSDRLVAGKVPDYSDSSRANEILISKSITDKLNFQIDDKILVYFIDEKQRLRPRFFELVGIYETGLEEYDKAYCIINLKQIQKINGWATNQVGGFEIFIYDINKLDQTEEYVFQQIGVDLNSRTMKDINPNIFDWLDMQTLNKWVILILMVVVAAINMITVLLILVLERTHMIGVLKALGARSWSVQKIFLYNSIFIIIIGLFLGNVLGIGLCLVQQHFEIFTLPQESYYVSVVPVELNALHILLINFATIVICSLMLYIPSLLVTRIPPYQAIRFE
ncbi:MAG: ABC transporter permease [Bacteroidetes bacterium]|nr:ABC transporter permease [Bacteroidota bacterium]